MILCSYTSFKKPILSANCFLLFKTLKDDGGKGADGKRCGLVLVTLCLSFWPGAGAVRVVTQDGALTIQTQRGAREKTGSAGALSSPGLPAAAKPQVPWDSSPR